MKFAHDCRSDHSARWTHSKPAHHVLRPHSFIVLLIYCCPSTSHLTNLRVSVFLFYRLWISLILIIGVIYKVGLYIRDFSIIIDMAAIYVIYKLSEKSSWLLHVWHLNILSIMANLGFTSNFFMIIRIMNMICVWHFFSNFSYAWFQRLVDILIKYTANIVHSSPKFSGSCVLFSNLVLSLCSALIGEVLGVLVVGD